MFVYYHLSNRTPVLQFSIVMYLHKEKWQEFIYFCRLATAGKRVNLVYRSRDSGDLRVTNERTGLRFPVIQFIINPFRRWFILNHDGCVLVNTFRDILLGENHYLYISHIYSYIQVSVLISQRLFPRLIFPSMFVVINDRFESRQQFEPYTVVVKPAVYDFQLTPV